MLQAYLKDHRLILASGSPRRQAFLKSLHVDFEVIVKSVEEVYPNELQAEAISDYLAVLKAKAFEGSLRSKDILITSDTIVWHNNIALGKPKDRQEAFSMLKDLSNSTHQVITSVCLSSTTKQSVFHDIASVEFKALDDDEIYFYIDHYKPYDKAGAYGIQEWIGAIGITSINGTYNTVVGLPTQLLYEKLKAFVREQ